MKMIIVLIITALTAIVLAGCNNSISPAAVTTLAKEDTASTQMNQQNYQAVTQAIAQKKDIRPFLKQEPSLEKKTFGGKTLLFDAAFFANKDAVEALIESGADVNFKTGLGMTPMDSAVSSKATEVIAVLKEHGGAAGTSH